MTFPTVATENSSSVGTNETSHTVSLPTGISSGDLLVAEVSVGADNAVTWPAGWTELFDTNPTPGARDVTISAAYRKADGTEGASITVTTLNASTSSHKTYRITGAEDPATQAPEFATAGGGNNTTADCPSLTPTGGAKDYLWLVFTGFERNTTVSAFPYGAGNEGSVTGLGDGHIAWDRTALNAASEDPGAFTFATNSGWGTATIAIHPDASVGGGGDISATGTLSFAGSANLSATGSLAATGAVSFAGFADLDATGSLAAAGAIAFAGAAALTSGADNDLAATGALTFGSSANLTALGQLAATGAIAFAESAELSAAGALVAAGSIAWASSADLDALGSLEASGSLVFASSADLDAIGALLASAGFTISALATLTDANAVIVDVRPITLHRDLNIQVGTDRAVLTRHRSRLIED